MISRRVFFSVTLMMVVLLFLFQFTEVIKDNWNEYEKNEYWQEEEGTALSQSWGQPISEEAQEGQYTVFVGKAEEEGIGSIVSQWCLYTKRTLYSYTDLESCTGQGRDKPEVLVLDGRILEKKDVSLLMKIAEQGTPIIFCRLPGEELLSEEKELRNLLGISELKEEKKEISGVRLFSGFLLGGEVIYEAKKEEEQKLQDFEMTVPWYELNSGTKVYMAGTTGEAVMNKESSPPLIWRNSFQGTMVFGVNGRYMEENTGIGILSAMMSETGEYSLYPIINAQNLTIVNYPVLASENSGEMKLLYSRSQKDVMRDIIWPGIVMITEKSQFKFTCMLNTQLDYADENQPQENNLIYYLKLLKEQEGEMGISAEHGGEIMLEEKVLQDETFWDCAENSYQYGSLYISREEIQEWADLEKPLGDNVRTVAAGYDSDGRIVGYISDNVTLQSTTSDGFRHTYRDNLRMRSLQTALGYSNIEVNMKSILWPEEADDRWELKADEFARNVTTYWKPFAKFEKTVLLESDRRIRNFLAMNYKQSRHGNCISLEVEAPDSRTWFILRTHGETVESINGGICEKLEEDAYLIETEEPKVEIYLEKERDIKIK